LVWVHGTGIGKVVFFDLLFGTTVFSGFIVHGVVFVAIVLMALMAAAGGEESSHGETEKNHFEILHFNKF
jgi:hypothetical protein